MMNGWGGRETKQLLTSGLLGSRGEKRGSCFAAEDSVTALRATLSWLSGAERDGATYDPDGF